MGSDSFKYRNFWRLSKWLHSFRVLWQNLEKRLVVQLRISVLLKRKPTSQQHDKTSYQGFNCNTPSFTTSTISALWQETAPWRTWNLDFSSYCARGLTLKYLLRNLEERHPISAYWKDWFQVVLVVGLVLIDCVQLDSSVVLTRRLKTNQKQWMRDGGGGAHFSARIFSWLKPLYGFSFTDFLQKLCENFSYFLNQYSAVSWTLMQSCNFHLSLAY